MRIALISPYDYAAAGGVTEHVTNLNAHLRRLGHESTILAPVSRRGRDLDPGVIALSRSVLPVNTNGSVARLSFSPAVVSKLRAMLTTESFDIAHLHEPLVPLVNLAAALVSKVPLVGTIHGYRGDYWLYRALRRPLSRTMGAMAARLAVSVDARDGIAHYFPGDYHIVPDGVETRRFAPRPDDSRLEEDVGPPTVLFVGRLEERKGLRFLLEAMVRVQMTIPDARLVVVGDFDSRQGRRWLSVAASLGIDHCDFRGYVGPDELPEIYRSADVFCAPSTGQEALGIVLLEAMASGLPIVTTSIPGYRTVITDGREGLLVPPENANALGEAILALLRDPDRRLRMGKAGTHRAAHYDWQTVTAEIVRIYEHVLGPEASQKTE